MKKFLLSLAVTLTAAFGASAQTVIKANQIDVSQATTVGGYTIELQKNAGTTAPAYHAATDAIRLYAKGSMTISGEKITKVVVTLASDGAYRYTTFVPSVGEISPAQATGDTEITWVGDAQSVTFTVGEKATMGTDGETKAGQIRFASVTVYGEGGAVTPDPDPTPDPTPDPNPGEEGVTTISAKQFDVTAATTVGGFTVQLQKNAGTTAPAYHAGTDAIRLYAKGSLTVSGEQISKIVVTLASDAAFRYTTFVPSVGELNPAQAAGDTEITWVGDAKSVTFTVGDYATMGTDGETKAGQIRFSKITVYGKGGNGGETPEPPVAGAPTEGPGSEEQPLTIAEAQAKNNDGSINWVNGYIVGVYDYVEGTGNVIDTEAPFTTGTNIVLASTENGTDYFSVQLPANSDVREKLNLVDRPALLGREVSVCGKLQKYCGVNGMKETTLYSVVGGVPPIAVNEVATLTAFIEEQDTENFFKITNPVTVFYQSGSYLFITDGTSNIEVYGKLANTYKNGDQLTGIIGKFAYYQNMPQMTPQADSFGAATEGTPVEPEATTLDKVQIAQYVTISGVDIVEVPAAEEGKASTWNVVSGNETRQLFDRFSIGGIKAATNVKITGIGAIYGETLQVFPVAIDYDSTSISEISAEATAATAVYDLQGRRLAAPIKGINIINGKKVLVK